MSLLARALLITAALALLAAPAVAKEIKGAPKALIGAFGKDAAQCRSFNRKGGEDITFVSKDSYSDCGGKQCAATILSHRPISVGFVLKLFYTSPYSTRNETLTATRVDKNTYKFNFDGTPQTLVRCLTKDVIAGIGLEPIFSEEPVSFDRNFAFYYALTVPSLCGNLEVTKDLTPHALITSDELSKRQLANFAAQSDQGEIPNFCKEVLGAYGKNGRVIPDLLRPSSQASTAGVAKETKGTPETLRGVFADRPEKCADWSEDDGFRIKFSDSDYNTCGGLVCEVEIISHTATRAGFILKVRHWLRRKKGPAYPLKIDVIDQDTIVYVARKPTTLRRCPYGNE
jgi:hypothetical protein